MRRKNNQKNNLGMNKGGFMKRYLIACGLGLLLSIIGCSGILLHRAPDPGDLTPEQIEAYNKVGSKVYSCFQIAGPPPAGGSTIVTVPKETQGTVKFLPGCQIQMQ